MDWEKVAGGEPEEEEDTEEKPPAKRISVEEILARVKPKKKIGGKSSLRIQKNGMDCNSFNFSYVFLSVSP